MDYHSFYKKLFLIIFLSFTTTLLFAQTTVSGTVTDAGNKKPLSYVTVSFLGSTIGVTTNEDGKFTIRSVNPQSRLQVSFVGYKTATLALTPGKDQVVNVRLFPESQELSEVTVKGARRPKYTNRDNPAVELIRKVIANKEKNQPESYNYVEYKTYDKMQFSFLNVSDKLAEKKFFRKYKFMFDNRDTVTVPGKSLLPFYLNEKISQTYYRKSPEDKRTKVLGERGVNFGGAVDSEGIGQYFKHMYAEINIYDANVLFLTNQWMSPISSLAPSFYKFFITDTITTEQNAKLVELSFTPRNTTDRLFEGKMYITLDGNYAVQKAVLYANRNINLNFVKSMRVDLDFEQNPDGRYHLSKSHTVADFAYNKESAKGFLGIRSLTFGNYVINQPRLDTA
ncbi:MAG: carboxypeptidase-like regulatory domain-containing protein, partial [Sphingobacteriaceae bacterium]